MEDRCQVELPIERIDEALLSCAIPGFWGELCVDVELLPAVAFGVALHIERKTVTQTGVSRSDGPVLPSNERVAKVRQSLSQVSKKFRIECPVSSLRARFRDGHITGIEVAEISIERAGVA